jgi:hypothetical protein
MAGFQDRSVSRPRLHPLGFFGHIRQSLPISCLLLCAIEGWAGVGGTVSGTIKDVSGAVIGSAVVTITNTGTGIKQVVTSDAKGFYSFPSLPIGHYNLEVASANLSAT